jgi:ferric iron reductase protein FhuF
MKAVTKGKRRLTLSLCGLGWLDETEIQTIPDATAVIVDDTGEIVTPVTMTYEIAAAMIATGHGEEKRFDSLTSQQLQYVVEHSKDISKVEAALLVLEHDFNMPRPTHF